MNPRLQRNLKIVAVAHVGLVLGILVTEWVRSLVEKRRPHEIVTFIDFSAMPPAPEAPAAEPAPEPPPPEPPPPPPPEPAAIPETPPPKPPKPPIERSTRRVTRDQVEPKQPTPRRPTAEEIRRALGPAAPTGAPLDDFPFDWYFAVVRNAFYEAWQRPTASEVPPGTTVLVSIRVLRDGTVKEHRVVRASGNAVMDASVIRAVESVRRLQALPAQYRGEHRDITVLFELAGM